MNKCKQIDIHVVKRDTAWLATSQARVLKECLTVTVLFPELIFKAYEVRRRRRKRRRKKWRYIFTFSVTLASIFARSLTDFCGREKRSSERLRQIVSSMFPSIGGNRIGSQADPNHISEVDEKDISCADSESNHTELQWLAYLIIIIVNKSNTCFFFLSQQRSFSRRLYDLMSLDRWSWSFFCFSYLIDFFTRKIALSSLLALKLLFALLYTIRSNKFKMMIMWRDGKAPLNHFKSFTHT